MNPKIKHMISLRRSSWRSKSNYEALDDHQEQSNESVIDKNENVMRQGTGHKECDFKQRHMNPFSMCLKGANSDVMTDHAHMNVITDFGSTDFSILTMNYSFLDSDDDEMHEEDGLILLSPLYKENSPFVQSTPSIRGALNKAIKTVQKGVKRGWHDTVNNSAIKKQRQSQAFSNLQDPEGTLC